MNSEYVFVAWGIGITPFRSMIQYMIDKNLQKQMTLFYNVSNPNDFLFKDIFSKAEKQLGLKTLYLSDKKIDEKLLKQVVQEPLNVTYYLSGPQSIVEEFREILFKIGIENNKIKTDLFTGYGQVE
jgi:ferredoxin-NADP reductase